MATWRELADDSMAASKKLVQEEHYRSSVSRSYYAAYCAATGIITRSRTRFAHGRRNPAHEEIPELIRSSGELPMNTRRRLNKRIRILRAARENADYRPGITVNRHQALNALREATAVLQELSKNE